MVTNNDPAQFGFIGVGVIASAMVEGLCRNSVIAPSILLSPRGKTRSADLAKRYPNVRVGNDNQAVIDGAR
jgi:pyrroline-5-carboxylate reductase